MNKIITDQHNYNDVLIVPGRSGYQSRKDVELCVQIGKHRVIPLVAANMDTVGTLTMAKTLYEHQCMTALHKHYDLDTLVQWFKKPHSQYCFYSMGTRDQDINKFNAFVQAFGYPDYICVDVANGHTDDFVNKCQLIRDRAVNSYIMAGNVVTADAALRLAQVGINCTKVGIGPGCFTKNMLVETKYGKQHINNVQIGDEVLTHTLSWRKVVNKFIHTHHKVGMIINDIETTPNHEFYVLHKKYKNVVSDDNVHQYAEWVSAEKLTNDYYLLNPNNL